MTNKKADKKTESQTDSMAEQAPNKKKRMSLKKKLFVFALISGAVGAVSIGIAALIAIIHYGRDLPDYRQLANYEPAIVTRVHAGDGSLIREYARQPRLFVPIEVVPEDLVNAFLAAEDKNFYNHSGLDYWGLFKSQVANVPRLVQGRRLLGASTITQQVARNFLLTLDRRLDRKIKEMILTLRIERAFSKDQILELYLNEINFGNQSYGVATAALNYFNKALNELTIAQMAYLAAIPKGPHNYHPVRHKERAIGRRNWVLSRMLINGFITEEQYEEAVNEDLVMIPRDKPSSFEADYYAEEVRRRLGRMFGNDTLYEGGLSVRTSLEPRLQSIAEKALKDGLIAYDRRHGWRGPLGKMAVDANWVEALSRFERALGRESWQLAVVHELNGQGSIIGLQDGSFGFIELDEMIWARAWRQGERLGPKVKDPSDVLNLGDVIIVSKFSGSNAKQTDLTGFIDYEGNAITSVPNFRLEQLPEIQGALVAMDPHTGRVLAMVGGFDFDTSQFNRATQAARQPGSAFKPFVYAAALENGFTPASLVLDAPFVINQGNGEGKWKPKNSSNKFYGPSTLRLGIEKSRNLMTVRLAQNIGMNKVTEYARRFGLADRMNYSLAASLGAGEVTLLELTAAYSMLVNGGREIKPSLVDRIQDRRGKTVYMSHPANCPSCQQKMETIFEEPELPDDRKQIIDAMTAYQSVSMMEGVVTNGTGRKIRAIGKPLAGKTGTTNDSFDAWFVGFSPDLAVGVFTGFDRPRSLGLGEEGSSVAVPIFRDFMAEALKNTPAIPFRIPEGIRLVRINADTGQPARPGDARIIREAFKPGTEPRFGKLAVLDGSLPLVDNKSTLRKGSGGIY